MRHKIRLPEKLDDRSLTSQRFTTDYEKQTLLENNILTLASLREYFDDMPMWL